MRGVKLLPASSLEDISWIPADDLVVKYVFVKPYSAKILIEGILFNELLENV